MAYLTMKQLLESGVHFGHQTKRWNPKMKPYIFGARNGIYIIDLQQTVKFFKEASDQIRDVVAKGGHVLFVGTKKQAQAAIAQEAARAGMGYINSRWIGGFLTNFATVRKSIDRLNELSVIEGNPIYAAATKKETLMFQRERERLDKYLGGVRSLKTTPSAIFIIDSKKETIAIKEANRLGIKVIAVVDTNCDPDEVDYVIPGNDDAIRAIKLFATAIADSCLDGKKIFDEKLLSKTDKSAGATVDFAAAMGVAPAEAPKEPAPQEAVVAEKTPQA
ncbi:MAG: 30S ribosomal protein S2 [Deltaproteobacteria bacterium]